MSGIGELIEARSAAVILGPGGVGKTTIAASLAAAAARRLDGDVLVLTVDPARRLADALGVAIAGNEAQQVDDNLYAAMLDPGLAWDAMVRSASTDPELLERLLANPVYRQIADTFVHGNDYAALAWLDDALTADRWRLVVVDTPPAQSALSLFDAPARVEEFFGSSLLGWLTRGQSGLVIGGAAAKTFAAVADRILGAQFFSDVATFFEQMQEVVPAMVGRTARVADELSGEGAVRVAVLAPTPDLSDRERRLAEELSDRRMTLDGLVVNGVEPDVFANPKVVDVAQRVVAGDRSPFSARNTSLLHPGAEYVQQRCRLAALQGEVVHGLDVDEVVAVPRTVHSPTDLEALTMLGQHLWASD